MLTRLKALLTRSRERESRRIGDEYATMSPREREEADAVHREGAAGERDVLYRTGGRARRGARGGPPAGLLTGEARLAGAGLSDEDHRAGPPQQRSATRR